MTKGEMTKVARELNRNIRLSQKVYYKRLKTEPDLLLGRSNLVIMTYLLGILLGRGVSVSEVINQDNYKDVDVYIDEIFERANKLLKS